MIKENPIFRFINNNKYQIAALLPLGLVSCQSTTPTQEDLRAYEQNQIPQHTPHPDETPQPTNTSHPDVVDNPFIYFEGGQAHLGTNQGEQRHEECRAAIITYNQTREQHQPHQNPDTICGPEDDPSYFTDNPPHTVTLDPYYLQIREAPFYGTYEEAVEYCQSIGARLPSPDEWEAAARGFGPNPRTFPWGEGQITPRRADYDAQIGNPGRTVSEPGSHPHGDTPEGLQDMAGRNWERVGEAEARGGGSGSMYIFLDPTHIGFVEEGGVRCARDADKGF